MSLLLAWLVLPLVALVVLWGCGLLAAAAAGGERPPDGLVLGLGLAVVILAASLLTQLPATAPLAAPVVVVLAAAGLALARGAARPHPDRWALAAGAGVFAVYAAPFVLSGAATFGGYSVLGDTAIHFLAADQLLRDGYDLSALPASSYRTALEGYYGTAGYPAGAQLAAGTLRDLVGLDIAWVLPPFLALLGVLVAAAAWTLATPWIARRPLRALAAFTAAQPALFYAYALQGSVKEVAGLWSVLLVAALIPWWLERCRESPRRVLPLAVATGAALAVLSLSILPWLAPLLLIAPVAAWHAAGLRGRALAGAAGTFAATALVLALPALRSLGEFLDVTTAVVTAQTELGNLRAPLSRLQGAGIWLAEDFRERPEGLARLLTWASLAAAAVGGLAAAVWAVRGRRWYPLALAGTAALAAAYVLQRGSPWADAKALAMTGPLVLLGVMVGAAALARRSAPAGWTVALLVSGGVLASNALAYHAVALAPEQRLRELAELGERYAGRGPASVPDFDDFTKHFLRRAAPVGGDAQRDTDQIAAAELLARPLIVRRRAAAASRPPAPFALDRRGRFWEVWARGEGPEVVRHVPLGDAASPLAVPACAEVRALATEATAAGGRVAAALRRPPVVLAVAGLTPLPDGWRPDPGAPATLYAPAPGTVRGSVDVPRGGRYELFLEGSFGPAVSVRIDGRRVARVRDRVAYAGQSEPLGTVRLTAGRHAVAISQAGGGLRPSAGGARWRIGRLWLDPRPDGARVLTVAPGRAPAALCGRPLDWLAIVR